MNKKLYESLFYKLTADSIIAESEFEDLMLKSHCVTNKSLGEAQCALMHLVQLRAAIHELTTKYQPKYNAPDPADTASNTEKERWTKLMDRLQNIENYSNPMWMPSTRTEPLSHEDLLERSSAYRDSQHVPHDTVAKKSSSDDEE